LIVIYRVEYPVCELGLPRVKTLFTSNAEQVFLVAVLNTTVDVLGVSNWTSLLEPFKHERRDYVTEL